MATPGQAISAATYQATSEAYLTLWRQLGQISLDAVWLALKPESDEVLHQRIQTLMKSLALHASSALSHDYLKTQSLPASKTAAGTEIESFREYLRDTALRFAELADSLESPVLGRLPWLDPMGQRTDSQCPADQP